MVKVVFVRTAGALGVMSLALFIVGIVPFLSADPTAGAGLFKAPYTVNHEFKGDRLPLAAVDRVFSRRHIAVACAHARRNPARLRSRLLSRFVAAHGLFLWALHDLMSRLFALSIAVRGEAHVRFFPFF